MQLADSLNRLGTETAFEVLARAKALEASGRRIIHLQIGEPDFTTPRHIIDAGRKAWADGETHYCPAPGLPVLREACAAHLSQHRGLEIDPGNIVVAPGAKPFLFFGVLATCNPGDEVGARLGDERPAARAGADLDHALGLERAQRLAQRRARDPEGDAEVALAGQALARLDAARRDRIADLADDVIERAHALGGHEGVQCGGGVGQGLTAPE